MTLLLAHPADEDLGRFVEGTLPDTERREVVAHIADCDECRILVVDSAEFIEPRIVHSNRPWWLATAAGVAIVLAGTFAWQTQRNPLAPVIEASAHQEFRPIAGRLSGFRHVPRNTMRGAVEADSVRSLVEERAYEVLERHGDDPRMQHAKGVARLLAAQARFAEISEQLANSATAERKDAFETAHRDFVVEQNAAIALLQSAAVRVPDNASYQSDLAAALIETRDTANLNRAIKVCDRALQLDRRSPEALFNRAIALRELPDPQKAIAAFKLYLTVDPSSPWAGEARTDLNQLEQSL
jgi:tetratricopeptide (TPR) repeat protein